MTDDLTDASDWLTAERDENTQRKEMLPSETTALAMRLDEVEKVAAKARQQEAGKTSGQGMDSLWSRDHKLSQPDWRSEAARKSRNIAAEAVGMSEATYRRMKQKDPPGQILTVEPGAVDVVHTLGTVRSTGWRPVRP